jgi:steroid 5-alpha reductase family enzyme
MWTVIKLMQETRSMDETALEWWIFPITVFSFNIVFYVVCQFAKDNSLIDTAWGCLPILPLVVLILYQSS